MSMISTKIKQLLKDACPKITVIGDIILDQYIWSSVNRISPEAPVPICLVNKSSYVLGGAANVANNMVAFGAHTTCLGVIGTDSNGQIIKDLMKKNKINCDLLIESNTNSTICKARVIAKNQQLCRLDYESDSASFNQQSQRLMDQMNAIFDQSDVIIISDYNKGTVTEALSQFVINASKQRGIPVIVDPKGPYGKKYCGATLITPNNMELIGMTALNDGASDADINSVAKELLAELNFDSMALTRSEHGIRWFDGDQVIDYPTTVQSVTDVTGAGDTVVAALALSMALNVPVDDMVRFANLSAGVVVSKVGTATASLDDIIEHETHLH